jgi:hypothetical protein
MEFKKRGTLFVPVKSVMFEFICTIDNQQITDKKMYTYLKLSESQQNRINEVHKASNQYLQTKLMNPLQGDILKVKVPYKYNKVTCKVSGNKVLQELVKGDQATVVIEYCGVWAVNGYCGPSWKLFSLICQ